MRNIIAFTLATLILLTGCHSQNNADREQVINSAIGNISFVKKYGVEPDRETDEKLRITTHLAYVEVLLREKDVSSLPTELRENRAKLLDLLHDYWNAGSFPKNYDYPDERKPCFIDKDGNICAVGFLVEQTAGRETAEKINALFKYSEITDMQLPDLEQWIGKSGLTLEECAMIQPAYNFQKPDSHIEPSYAISSSVLSGANVSLMALNGLQMAKSSQGKAIPYLGLVAGTGQLALGIIKYPGEQNTMSGSFTDKSKRNLSMVNMGLGAGTMVLSAYNLLSNRETIKEKRTAWNIFSYPTVENQAGIGVAYRKLF